MLAVIIFKFNHAKTFIDGFLISFLLWNVVDWYDAFIIDILWFCHCKKIILPGTEDMIREYHNYWFHIVGSFKGMIIGVPVCTIVGLFVMMLKFIG